MLTTLFINWNPDPVIFSLGPIPLRYYGLLWVIGIALAYLVVRFQFRDKKIGDNKFDPLLWYCVLGVFIGARLGHCIFYEPEHYLTSLTGIVEMLLPFRYVGGSWHWAGYAGLASHGGTLGLIVGIGLYCRKYKVHFMDILDMLGVAAPIAACCIRLANLMNSEIIGKSTDVAWAFVFERIDKLPRHPAQLYEAIAYFVFFLLMLFIYKQYGKKVRRGFFFGLCLTEIFAFRFFIEFLKENQVDFEQSMTFNMGQWLSIPFILIGLYCMFFYGNKGKVKAS
ncbi:MAG: prolipoprotein diacylglyceryl transferase [Mediterranea sp.]|jgi:prolipoprotein diacylglyceryl transferase|nr:prolipoprotein diacylglyceryl transferase [Mediterranea sp.]